MSRIKNLFAVVEISKGSRLKYEVDKTTGRLVLDRVLHGSCVYPYNYGYIENTLDGDGDPLDIVIISQEVLMPGVKVPVRVVGALRMIDSGDRDTKLIGVVAVDPRYKEWKNLKNIPSGILAEIEDFFKNYKNLEEKTVILNGWASEKSEINDIIKLAFDLFNNKEKA